MNVSVCPRAYFRNYISDRHEKNRACKTWPWLCPALYSGVEIRYKFPVLWTTSCFTQWAVRSVSIPLQRVTPLRRRAQANAPAASYWFRRVLWTTAGRRDKTSPSCRGAGGEACNAPSHCLIIYNFISPSYMTA